VALKIKAIIGIILALLFGIVCLFDYLSIGRNSSEYQMVYHFSETSQYWKFQSIGNYRAWNLIQISICSIYIILNIFFLIKGSRYLKCVLLGIESLAVIWVILQVYQWYGSGFDH
jgi:hypothetical protein